MACVPHALELMASGRLASDVAVLLPRVVVQRRLCMNMGWAGRDSWSGACSGQNARNSRDEGAWRVNQSIRVVDRHDFGLIRAPTHLWLAGGAPWSLRGRVQIHDSPSMGRLIPRRSHVMLHADGALGGAIWIATVVAAMWSSLGCLSAGKMLSNNVSTAGSLCVCLSLSLLGGGHETHRP